MDREIRPYLVPNDPLYSQQWGLHNTSTVFCGMMPIAFANLIAEPAWDQTTGSTNVNVAILDSGIDSTHIDLRSVGGTGHRVRFGPSYDPFAPEPFDGTYARHGTAVTGIAAATGNNAVGLAGVAWNVVPWAVKIFDDFTTRGYTSWMLAGIEWARISGMKIINISGGTTLDPGQPDLFHPDTLRSMLNVCLNARLSGVLIVAAAGNVRINPDAEVDTIPAYPAAAYNRVCAVGAMLPDGNPWRDDRIINDGTAYCASTGFCSASNGGAWLDLLAPGGRFITTTWNGTESTYWRYFGCTSAPQDIEAIDTLSTFTGTSASAPFVTGTAALLLSAHSDLNGEDLENIMKRTAFNTNGLGTFDPFQGWGRTRASNALQFVASPKLIAHWVVGLAAPAGIGAFSVVDSMYVRRSFADVPELGPGVITRNCWRYTLRDTVTFPFSFAPPSVYPYPPDLWVTASGSRGWRDTTFFQYSYEVPWGRVEPVGNGRSRATLTRPIREGDSAMPLVA